MSFSYTNELLDQALTYQQYRSLVDKELETSAPATDKEQAILQYTSMNVQRMKRLDKTIQLTEIIKEAIATAPACTWLVLTEGWCGDAAQINPVFHAVEKASCGNITLHFLLRDQNLELMDAHLTNGTRSIPKLIVLDKDLNVVGTWGSRPTPLQALIPDWKADPQLADGGWAEKVHAWYAADTTAATQQELTTLIQAYTDKP